MTNKSKMLRFPKLILAAGFVFAAGSFTVANAQRDPFEKSPMMKPRVAASAPSSAASAAPNQPKAVKPKPPGPPPVVTLGAPPIDQRISYYKRLREEAATNGSEIPKVTSVLTLDEMSVIGIFRTPRGYAAMVQAAPINLSYTIYPGEKFFDGQLVAVEENRLVFRKVAKMSNGKFTASVENKPLRQYTVKEEVQGTAPVQPSSGARTETANNSAQPMQPAGGGGTPNVIVPTVGIVSPLEEMLRQPAEKPKDDAAKNKKDSAKDKNAKKGKKSVKVAVNKKQK